MNKGSMAWVCGSILLLLSGCSRNDEPVHKHVDLRREGFAAKAYRFDIVDKLTLGMSEREVLDTIGPPNDTHGFGTTFWVYDLNERDGNVYLCFGSPREGLLYLRLSYSEGIGRTVIVRYTKGSEGIAACISEVSTSLPATGRGP